MIKQRIDWQSRRKNRIAIYCKKKRVMEESRMEEKIVERIIEMLKEPDFHIVEGALKGLTELADVEFKSILNDIIVERWIQTPKDVPFSYA